MERTELGKLDDKFTHLKNLLYIRADKIEEQASALRQEINQLAYIVRDLEKLVK